MCTEALSSLRPGKRCGMWIDVILRGNAECAQYSNRPRGSPTVDEGDDERLLGALGVAGDDTRGPVGYAGEVVQRLGDAPEDEADTHTRGEEHGEPGDEPELGPLVVGAQRDVPEVAQAHPQREDDEGGDQRRVVPAEPGDDPALDRVDDLADRVAPDDGDGDEREDEDQIGRASWRERVESAWLKAE